MKNGSDRRVLHVDIETFSDEDIGKCGLYRYAESKAFRILLISYALDASPVVTLDLAEDAEESAAGVRDLLPLLLDTEVVKVAHNCAFERFCLGKHYGVYLPPEQWEDTMILASYNGLPMSLDAVGAALQLQNQKLREGSQLIRYFCQPCNPTAVNHGRTVNKPSDAPEKWERFITYNRRDVEVERALYDRLHHFPVTPFERRVFCTDARINERGVLVDTQLAESAVEVDNSFRGTAAAEMQRLTGLENPNSVSQLKGWLEARGYPLESLGKESVKDALRGSTGSVKRVLELRSLLGKTSTSKYEAMLRAACSDGRVRGITQYYGAGRTGRWAGRLVQLQNLPQNHLDEIGKVRDVVRQKDLETLEMCFESVPDTLSQLIRTAFIAKPGNIFLIADYSAIEARVTAYLSGTKWRMETFRNGGDIYCASASQMFKVPVEKHGVNGHLRQKGKIAELALGYGGGVGALKAFGADKMGLTDEEMQDIVTRWRSTSPEIPKMWRDVEDVVREALHVPGHTTKARCGVAYKRDDRALRCRLPSGRVISYWAARVNDDGEISYMAQNQVTRQWAETTTWGGKLVENIVQAFARDCLATAMVRLEDAGYQICFHVHDEIIAEMPIGSKWEDMAKIMSLPVPWAEGLILTADGYETPFYMKD